jgi:gluconate kinase
MHEGAGSGGFLVSESQRLTSWERVVVGAVVLAWFALKVSYREVVKKQYGFFSLAYLRADLVSLAILAAITALGILIGRRWRAGK